MPTQPKSDDTVRDAGTPWHISPNEPNAAYSCENYTIMRHDGLPAICCTFIDRWMAEMIIEAVNAHHAA